MHNIVRLTKLALQELDKELDGKNQMTSTQLNLAKDLAYTLYYLNENKQNGNEMMPIGTGLPKTNGY